VFQCASWVTGFPAIASIWIRHFVLHRTHAPGECPSPLGGDSRDIHAALFPLGFPKLGDG
jgi:hypothetical protein